GYGASPGTACLEAASTVAQVAISPYIVGVRRPIGTDLLLVPALAVLPFDSNGRAVLVREAGTRHWMAIRGTIEPHMAPEDGAGREAEEGAGVVVTRGRVLAALGGPDYRITYPNGDRAACVPIVYEGTVSSGIPRPDHDETSEVNWFH